MAPGHRIFLDANVALDPLADRQPFAEHAHLLFALAETRELAVSRKSIRDFRAVNALAPRRGSSKRA